MKVICAGMSKTGTKSMHVALEKLEYSVHDYSDAFDVFKNEYTKFYDQGWTVSDFRRMYENIDAVVDGPAYYYWEELAKAFPDAKVVLTIIDDDVAWFKSISRQTAQLDTQSFYYYPFLSPSWRRFWRFLYNSVLLSMSIDKVTGFETYLLPTKEIICRQAYRRHIAHVSNKCSKDRLLVFKCKNGWEPLCEFLDKAVPDEPFPKVNVKGEQAKLFWYIDIMKQATKEVQIGGSIIALALAVSGCVIIKRFWR